AVATRRCRRGARRGADLAARRGISRFQVSDGAGATAGCRRAARRRSRSSKLLTAHLRSGRSRGTLLGRWPQPIVLSPAASSHDGEREMRESDLSPARFGASFKEFMDAVLAAASPPTSPLLDRIRAHLGADAGQLPVIAEEFDPYEQPNVQVALDAF